MAGTGHWRPVATSRERSNKRLTLTARVDCGMNLSSARWRPEQLAGLMEPLGQSLAGEMARYLVPQRQGKQH